MADFQGKAGQGVVPQSRVGFGRVLRAVCITLGRPVLLHSLALGVALGIPSAILFSANGLRARDVIALSHHSLAARSVLWACWLLLSAPAMRVLLDAPGSRTLRALRLPRVSLVLALLALAVLVQLPWAILFARGGGSLEAGAAVSLAIALNASLVVALRRGRWIFAVAFGALLVLLDVGPSFAFACGALWAPFSLARAFRYALEQRKISLRLTRPTHPLLALYLMHLLRLLRSAQSRLMVACSSGVAGAAGLLFSLRNDPTPRILERALSALALPLTLAAAVLIAPVIESEYSLRALLHSLRVPRRFTLGAFFLAIATPSSALAASSGVAAGAACHASASVLGFTLFGWAMALSCAVSIWGRFLERRARRSAGLFAAGVALIAALALVLAFSC